MELEFIHDKIRYTFSNKNLKIKDKVFPLIMGRSRDDGSWVLHSISLKKDYMTGFPNEPHTILSFYNYSLEKFRRIKTDYGSSPEMCYFKVIKKEEQIKRNDKMFSYFIWIEIK